MAAGQGRLFISPSSLKLWDLCRNQACSGTRPAMRSATVLFGLCLILACTVALISLFLVPEKAGSSQLLGGDNGFASAFLSTLHSYQHSQASLLRKEQQLSAAQSNVMNVAQQLASTDPPSGITYSPSSQVGVSSEDQSPEIPRSFLLQEDRADARMKKLQRELKKTQSQQEEITKKIKDLNDFVASELTDVKSDVRERNTKLTDDISSASHDVVGVPGPPGLPGLPGQDGQAGQDGFDGTQGPRGTQGAPGPLGPAGSEGPQGQQGLRGPGGYGGGTGNTGPGGGEGDTGLIGGDASWAPSPYFCPSSSNEWTRLVDCNRNSCKLETNYDGVWGVVCGWYFSQVDADVVCRGLGFEEGGTATYRFGNSRTGPIWLSNVRCNGNEGDIGDCPKTCGGDGCDRHVGLCCWGQAIGEKGVRVSVPETYKTVQEFRDNCHFPPTCQESGGPKVALHQNCGGAQSGGWQSALGVGSYPRMDGGTCDNDAGRCIIPNCGLQNGDLSSMEVPAGVSVTLYSQANFKGSFVSYTGPMDVDCLVWDGWNDATRSLKISQAEQKAASEFKMRIFKSTAQLSSMPSLAVMNFVGEAVVPVISFHSGDEFRKYVPGTPDQNFVAVFYGTVSILSSGKYTFCSNSDDGSYVWVDNVMIVNNGGLHGDQRQCGPTDLSAGLHRIQVSVFQAGGAVGIFFSYSGPDTQGQYTRPRSESSTDGIPPLPPKSSWTMRLFSSPVHLGSFPDWTTLNYLGSRDGVELVNFNSAQDIRNLFANMPDSNYAWAFYGSITVQFAGQYSFCVFSHDGSVLIVDRELVIGDTGAHGATRSCGSRSLATGDHDIWIEGFTGDTAATIVATYAGPDTGGGEILIHSIGQIGWVPECPAPPSEWTLSVYSSATYLYCMPDLSVLTYVGRAKISIINFNSQHDFAQVVSQTPGENFAWSFDGTVSIHNAGAYTFCTTSDDGSFIYVDGSMIADDSNLHGMVQRCATREMTVGTHSVQVTGFQIWGGVGEQANYYGPDTGGVLRWLRSSKGTDPNVGKASQFTICAFQAWYFMGSMPSLAGLWYNGRGQMPVVNMWDINQFRQYVPNLPEYYCGWGIYGKLEIQRAGQYTLCTTSDDGSREYVDGVWVVNNDGLHGMSQACGSMFLSSGSHLLYMEGFQSGGGLGMQATYAGPDTNGLVLVRSGVACSPDKDGCH